MFQGFSSLLLETLNIWSTTRRNSEISQLYDKKIGCWHLKYAQHENTNAHTYIIQSHTPHKILKIQQCHLWLSLNDNNVKQQTQSHRRSAPRKPQKLCLVKNKDCQIWQEVPEQVSGGLLQSALARCRVSSSDEMQRWPVICDHLLMIW